MKKKANYPEITKIKELKKGGFYWIELKDCNMRKAEDITSWASQAGIKCLVTLGAIEFKDAPEGLKLKKCKGGWIATKS